ncbi:MAG TPA: MarR family transcriptional regulator [Candidatus Aenigmarchaeota archaeon]|nr:MarR family transcriptional regulator [Candidatus Aenigmarchaeota archaeon]
MGVENMDNRKIGIMLVALAIIIAVFGIYLKIYNDKIAQMQQAETGSCYLTDGTCIHTTSDVILYSSLGIAIFVTAIGLYLIFKKKEPGHVIIKRPMPKRKEITVAPKTLSLESKKIFDLLVQSNGTILQGELVAKSGMDKVKVSRILDKLEMQSLIERKRHGMSNLVILRKK